MKRFIISTAIAIAFFITADAKQEMTLLNGEEIDVEIVTIGTNQISYKKASNPNGPTYTVDKNKVFFIIYDDGTKEVITDLQSSSNISENNSTGMVNAATGIVESTEVIPPKRYFEHISFYPRASIGFHATPSGYKDSFDIDWGGLAWSVDLNVLFPSGNTSAWSTGIGVCGLGGEMQMLYTTNNGKDKHKDKMGSFTANYLTVPIGYWYKGSDIFMLGFTNRFEFLISQKMDGEKIKDTFNVFRDNFLIDGVFSIGHFDLGLQFGLNLTSALKGEDLDWSPTLSGSITAGYRF